MKFLLDESAEDRLASFLRDQGHDVTAIARDYAHALTDHDVLAISRDEGRILITNDRDFGELVVRRGARHHGVIYFRLAVGTTDKKIDALSKLLSTHADWLHEFVVVDARGPRM